MNAHDLKYGDLVRGTYWRSTPTPNLILLGIITDRDGDWLEVTWQDNDIDQYDIGDEYCLEEIEECWTLLSKCPG
jgi:hypothetical protein